MEKMKFAFYWAASCGGCEIAVLDIDEKILDVAEIADIVFWPVAMDTKYEDLEAMGDESIDVCFFNGAIRTEENEYMAKLMRQKAKVLVAFGSCACSGGIPGLANITVKDEVMNTAYKETVSTENPEGTMPRTRIEVKEGEMELPELFDTVKSLDQTVDVDYYLPGCPPTPNVIVDAIDAIADGKLPPKGSVLAPLKSVCDECPLEKHEKKITEIKRVYEITPNGKDCLLEQGIICMGPATRSGCGALCPAAGMPCTGCFGACEGVTDQGAKMLSALASIMGLEDEAEMSEEEVEAMMKQVKDPIGTFYRYGLPVSILRRARVKKEAE